MNKILALHKIRSRVTGVHRPLQNNNLRNAILMNLPQWFFLGVRVRAKDRVWGAINRLWSRR